MFPRQERLTRASFPTTNTPTQRVSSAHFVAVVPTTGTGYAVVVSKKVARLSVKRHQMKRQVLSALRTLSLPPSLVVFPRPTARTLDFQSTKTELTTLLSKIRK